MSTLDREILVGRFPNKDDVLELLREEDDVLELLRGEDDVLELLRGVGYPHELDFGI